MIGFLGFMRRSKQVMNSNKEKVKEMTQEGTAAVLSLIVPGVGQIYNGDYLRGVFWLIVTPGFWIGTGGLFGWIFHLISSYTAYRRGRKYAMGVL